jgi:hypothetical protein
MHIESFQLNFFFNCKERWFLRIKGPRFSKIFFYYKSSFLKGSFVAKELDMELKAIFDFFLRLFFIFFQRTFQFFYNF